MPWNEGERKIISIQAQLHDFFSPPITWICFNILFILLQVIKINTILNEFCTSKFNYRQTLFPNACVNCTQLKLTINKTVAKMLKIKTVVVVRDPRTAILEVCVLQQRDAVPTHSFDNSDWERHRHNKKWNWILDINTSHQSIVCSVA